MHTVVKNLIDITNLVHTKVKECNIENIPKIIAVSKTFEIQQIMPLIEYGHVDFGENKVQEAIDKWTNVKLKSPRIKLHLIGKLQTNKVKTALKIFDYIHSVDSEKLAKKISDEQEKQKKKVSIFIQVNIGNEIQKSGISPNHAVSFLNYCKNLNLNVVGFMCIPPVNENPIEYFKTIKTLTNKSGLSKLSMGMSSDFLAATEEGSTHLRIGSSIFGKRNYSIWILVLGLISLAKIIKSFFFKAIHPAVGL